MSPSPNSIHRNSQRAYEAANHQGNRELVVRVVRERAPIATWQIEEALQAEGHKAMHQTISATVSGLLDIGVHRRGRPLHEPQQAPDGDARPDRERRPPGSRGGGQGRSRRRPGARRDAGHVESGAEQLDPQGDRGPAPGP
jgi:hypothetical protein